MRIPLFPFLSALALLCFGTAQDASAQVWSFGFEDADYTAAGGGALVFDQTFDGVANSGATIDSTYTGATDDLVFGGDYTVLTNTAPGSAGFDAHSGNNFAFLATDHKCIGVDGNEIGLNNGQVYRATFYIAALDPDLGSPASFSVSGAFEMSNGVNGEIYGTEQGRAYLDSNPIAGHTFTNPGLLPAATTTNDKTNLDWTLYTVDFTYNSANNKVFFSGLGDSGTGNSLAIDSLQIEAVPEPSSAILCLLGAGFWVFFGRRRRQTN